MAVVPKIRVKVLPQSKLRLRMTPAVPGAPGDDATIAIGTVTTLPPGSPATVTNVGDETAAIFDFGIPQGATGSGTGDMLAATYDPQNIADDAFDRANHTGTQLAATISDFSTAADARVSAAIGTSVQAYDADLTTWAGITPSANVQTFVSAANYAAMRTALGVAIGSDVQAYDADLASWALITRASGFDTFTATPSWTNFLALVTGEPTFYTSGGTDVSPADGGTGRSSHTAYGLIAGGTSSTSAQQSVAAGATTEILVGGGASALPVWTTATGTGAPARAGSPAFTGTPTAPTAAVDTNTTQLATTAMVLAQAAAATPLGAAPTAVVGASTRFARADHVHPGREVLTASRTYYVRTDGSDSNTGLANTSGGAFLTIQKAFDTVSGLDCSTFDVEIQCNAATRTAAVIWAGHIGSGQVTLTGDTTTPGNCILSTTSASAISLNAYTRLKVQGFRIQTTTFGYCVFVGYAATYTNGKNEFGSCASLHMAVSGGLIDLTTSYSIVGSAQGHLNPSNGGFVRGASITVTLTGTPAWSIGFIYGAAGITELYLVTYSGSATGSRYSISGLALINTFAAGTISTYFPGNSNGSTATGAQQI